MVLGALRQRLVPFVRLEFGGQGTVTLDEGHVYVEHYQPHLEVTRERCDRVAKGCAAWWCESPTTILRQLGSLVVWEYGVVKVR